MCGGGAEVQRWAPFSPFSSLQLQVSITSLIHSNGDLFDPQCRGEWWPWAFPAIQSSLSEQELKHGPPPPSWHSLRAPSLSWHSIF